MRPSIRIDQQSLNRVQRALVLASSKVEQSVQAQLHQEAFALLNDAKRRTPVGVSSFLRNSGYIDPSVRLTMEVGFNTRYAETVHNGREPGSWPWYESLIEWVRKVMGIGEYKEARSVAFLVSRKIYEDGTEPQPYMQEAYDRQIPGFYDRIGRAINRALTSL